jgi:uncharacterized membrane protein
MLSAVGSGVDHLVVRSLRAAARAGWAVMYVAAVGAAAFFVTPGALGVARAVRWGWWVGACVFGAAVYRWSSREQRSDAAPPVTKGELLALGLLYATFAVLLSRITLVNFHAFSPHTFDLGLYDNILWHTAHGDLLGCSYLKGGHHASAHFDPILLALAPIYRLAPGASTLLVVQVLWVGATALPLHLLAREKLGSPLAGLVFAAAYLLHPAVHGAALYEFHSLALASPLLVWMVYLLERRAYRRYASALAAALLCREDVALLACFVGLYAILRRERRSLRVGWLTILAGVSYLAVVKWLFMDSHDLLNDGAQSYGFSYYYADLIPKGSSAVRGILETILTNPLFVLQKVLIPAKLEFLVVVMLPLAFLPLLARPARVMLVYGVLFTMLASKPAVYSIAFQYSCVLVPLTFATAVLALADLHRCATVAAIGFDPARLRRALLAFVVTASAIVSYQRGVLNPAVEFYAGFQRVIRELDDVSRENYAWIRGAVDSIPEGASVAATSRAGAFISSRRDAYAYPTTHAIDYALVNGLDLAPAERSVRPPGYEVVSEHGPLVLYRVTHAP